MIFFSGHTYHLLSCWDFFLISSRGSIRVVYQFSGPCKLQISFPKDTPFNFSVASRKTNHTIHCTKCTFESRTLGVGFKAYLPLSGDKHILLFKDLKVCSSAFVFNLPEADGGVAFDSVTSSGVTCLASGPITAN